MNDCWTCGGSPSEEYFICETCASQAYVETELTDDCCPRCERQPEWHPHNGMICQGCGWEKPDDDDGEEEAEEGNVEQEDAPSIFSPDYGKVELAKVFYAEGRFSRALLLLRRAAGLRRRRATRSRLEKLANKAADDFMMRMAKSRC